MNYPAFFEKVPTIKMYDPLCDFLGSLEGGIIDYTYLDIVKFAGHSCPTVAGAYLMALKGFKALYGDDIPQRGGIRVEMRESITEGVTGVVANVFSFLTGATENSGFKGIGGNFDRRNLLFFNKNIQGIVRFVRLDTKKGVMLDYDPSFVPGSAKQQALMQKIMMKMASAEEKKEFGMLWQQRVEKILCDFRDDPRLVTVKLEV